MSLSPADIHTRLQLSLPFFAEKAPLYIKDKQGNLIVWRFNLAQQYTHDKLEAQLRELGRVRALILKGRQQGESTYVSGRFYHKSSRNQGKSVFILSHDGKTTDKLFKMVKRYQDNVREVLRPEEGASNRYQLHFAKLDSDYSVGTAGNENVGRGGTAQYFHGSECAYWKNAYEIQDGALESIGDVPGTEIILESTANGPVGLFYQKCMDALNKRGDYILIFIPWFWQDEYERPYNGEEITDEEKTYVETYFKKTFPYHSTPISKDKALRKIMWRRAKIIDLCTGQNIATGQAKFRQIYPSNPIEAFQATGIGLIRSDAIMAARKSTLVDQVSPIVAGVDPAGDSDSSDRTVIAIRKGRQLQHVLKFPRMRPMELAGICAKLFDTHRIDMMFIDRGYGEGTVDRLHELGFSRRVQGIAFNERTIYPDIYLNKRAEIIIECAKWLNAGNVNIPDDDEVHADFACMPLDAETSNGLKFIKSKREIKKEFGRSPDIYDAVALTFAYPVRREANMENRFFKKADNDSSFTRKNHGPLKSLRRGR